MNARAIPSQAVDDELERLVAQIRARGPGQMPPRPSPEAIAALVEHFLSEEPMSANDLAEHERQWRAVEDEMRAVEQADEQRDRLL